MAELPKPPIVFREMWRTDIPYLATTNVLKTNFAEGLGMASKETDRRSTYWYIEKPKTPEAFAAFGRAFKEKMDRSIQVKPFLMKYLDMFPGWKEPSEYLFKLRRNEEAKAIAESLIPKFHRRLTAADIGYFFVKKPVDEDETMTGDVVAKVKKAPSHIRHFIGMDFMVFFYDGYWEVMNRSQRRAVVDHELEHCTAKDGTWEIRDHDLIEFRSIIDRHPHFNASFAKLIAQVKSGELSPPPHWSNHTTK